MAGKGDGKILLGKANVYLHLKSNHSSVTHLDVELEEINNIIYPKEATFTGGKEGGVFLALKKEMIIRAEKLAEEKIKKK